jgi:hypothetical protein
VISAKQAPFTGPYASDATKHPHEGPTIEAIKRALARLGYMTWKGLDFTQRWPAGGELDKAFRKWERDKELPGNGTYGEQEWKFLRYEKVKEGPNAGKNALDSYACKLIRTDWAEQNVPDEQDFRAALVKFCLAAERNEPRWHYRMMRPLDVSVEPTASYVVSDCSMYVIQAYHWAMGKSGLVVPDPSKQGWSGYGNTSEHEDDHPRVSDGNYKVGMLAHYSGHVTLCRKPGTATTAVWSSHGQEAGPIPVSLSYRNDLRFVVIPPLR